ncbi:S1C family serine protease, partial [Streptomyces sparsus]
GHAQPWGAPPPPPRPGRKRGGMLAGLLAAVLIAGAIGGGVGFWAAERNTSASETVSAPNSSEAVDRAPDSVAGIAEKALPSVVTIQANGGSGQSGGGTGTGFVFDKQGHILTNNHVVAGAAGNGELTVVFSNGKKYRAEVVGRAQGYDIAVLKLRNAGDAELTPLPLGSSKEVAVGDSTIAIGAPFGLSGTVTTGIVSALNRPVASSDGEGSKASYMSALQTDASINPGNSGGPLLNSDGAVIGVNSAIQSASDGGLGGTAGSIGLGFAIPVDQAERVAKTLIETGEPVYPIIGATVDMKRQGDGAVISPQAVDGSAAVVPGGPADEAGLEPGDVITKLDGNRIDSGPTLISEIWTHEPGETVELTYRRDGKQQTTEVTLGKRVGDG